MSLWIDCFVFIVFIVGVCVTHMRHYGPRKFKDCEAGGRLFHQSAHKSEQHGVRARLVAIVECLREEFATTPDGPMKRLLHRRITGYEKQLCAVPSSPGKRFVCGVEMLSRQKPRLPTRETDKERRHREATAHLVGIRWEDPSTYRPRIIPLWATRPRLVTGLDDLKSRLNAAEHSGCPRYLKAERVIREAYRRWKARQAAQREL